MNTTHPLVIDADPSDIRVVASSLELHNRVQVDRAIAHNRLNRSRRQREVEANIRRVSEVGAEVIKRTTTTARSIKIDEVAKHYQLTEA